MIEFTIYAHEEEGGIGGVGFDFTPSEHERRSATCCYIFRRGDVRIHVLIFVGRVTEKEARSLAIALYEGRVQRINFNDLGYTAREAAIRGGKSFT